MEGKLYHIGIKSGADPHFVSFVLHFLDEVDEHVSLRQVLLGEHNCFTNVLLIHPCIECS